MAGKIFSTTYQSPLKMIHENLILTKEGYVWAYYRIVPQETNFNNREKLESYKRKWTNVFRKTLPRFKEFEFFMIPKDKQLASRFEMLQPDLAKDSFLLGTSYMNRTIEKLRSELGEITSPEFVLGVRLSDVYSNDNPVETVKRVADDVSDSVLLWLGKKQPVDMEILLKVKQIEDELYRALRSQRAIRLREAETVYLNRYNYIRNMEHDVEFESLHKERITDTFLDPTTDVGFLHLRADIGESVTAMLPIANFESVNIAGNHLFQLAQQMQFPVELRYKAYYVDPSGIRGFASKVSGKKRQLTAEAKATLEAGDPLSDKTKLGLQGADRIENELDKKEPILDWMPCFVVSGNTKKQCQVRGDSLIAMMDKLGIRVVRPSGKQLELFYRGLEGKNLEGQRDYLHTSNGETLAESLFAVTNNVGTDAGWYIGRTDYYDESETLLDSIRASRNIVLYNFLVANQGVARAMTDSPHIALTGETGKGKSYATKMIFFYSSFMNVKTLYIDPKQEVRKQFEAAMRNPILQQKYPAFLKHLQSFHYVTLDANDTHNHGVLDPIVFLTGVDAKDTAQAMINSIYDLRNKEEVETALNQSLDRVIELRELGQKVGFLTVIRELQASKEEKVKRAGDLLWSKINNSTLQLGFSDGSTDGLDLTKNVTVLEVAGLDLPDQETVMADYKEANKKSVCLMLPLGKFCEKFGNANKQEYTMEIFDEAWIFEKARGGKQILKSMQRVGRSFCNILVYSTQSVKDTRDDKGTSSFGTIFAFDWKDERAEILSHVGIENSEKNQAMLSKMKKGQCLFRDIYGRVAKLSVHNLFEEWDFAMKTVERTASSAAEEKFAYA